MSQASIEQPTPPTKEIQVKGPHAQRRFLQPLSTVQRLLHESSKTGGAGPESFAAHVLYKKNGRTPKFVLQGLARIYENLDLDDKLFMAIKLESKIIEDALGAVDFWWVVANKAKTWSMPAAVVHTAQERHREACGRTWAWLEARGWLESRYYEDADLTANVFAKKLKRVDWLSPRKEAKAILKWLTEEMRSVHEKIEGLDMNNIEHGVHEARRQIRWFSIYAGALEGGFVLDSAATAPSNWERYLQKEIIENPFNRLAAPEEKDVPIQIPAPLFYAMSYFIDRIGAVKDRAQWTETMKHLLHDTGEQLDRPLQDLMGPVYIEAPEAAKLSTEIVEQVLETDRLLPRMIEALEAQR